MPYTPQIGDIVALRNYPELKGIVIYLFNTEACVLRVCQWKEAWEEHKHLPLVRPTSLCGPAFAAETAEDPKRTRRYMLVYDGEIVPVPPANVFEQARRMYHDVRTKDR